MHAALQTHVKNYAGVLKEHDYYLSIHRIYQHYLLNTNTLLHRINGNNIISVSAIYPYLKLVCDTWDLNTGYNEITKLKNILTSWDNEIECVNVQDTIMHLHTLQQLLIENINTCSQQLHIAHTNKVAAELALDNFHKKYQYEIESCKPHKNYS